MAEHPESRDRRRRRDEAETTYLEVKSNLDLSTKAGTAKVAKFLLGAANRRPEEAARHLHGYAILMIGAQKNGAPGVPRGVEAHELEDRLRPYLGPHFPAFEFGRIRVDSENEVVVVIAPPPQRGQSIFPCHKTFQPDDGRDSLEDGAVYVRASSNTRPARSGEILALVERARGSRKPPIQLVIEVLGPICRVDRVNDVLEHLHQYEEKQFNQPPEPAENACTSASTLLPAGILGWGWLSAKDREEALNVWRKGMPEHLAKGREHFLGIGLPGAGIRVVSRDRSVDEPRLIVTFHGCELLNYLEPDAADYEKVVEPVVRQKALFRPAFDYSTSRPYPRDYPVSWSNQGDAPEVVITLDSFRPNVPWVSEQDDYVVIAKDPQADSVKVTWVLTEAGNDAVTSGELRVLTADLVDAADLFKSVFLDEG